MDNLSFANLVVSLRKYVRGPTKTLSAIMLVLASTIPVYFAHRLTREEEGAAAIRGSGAVAEATAIP